MQPDWHWTPPQPKRCRSFTVKHSDPAKDYVWIKSIWTGFPCIKTKGRVFFLIGGCTWSSWDRAELGSWRLKGATSAGPTPYPMFAESPSDSKIMNHGWRMLQTGPMFNQKHLGYLGSKMISICTTVLSILIKNLWGIPSSIDRTYERRKVRSFDVLNFEAPEDPPGVPGPDSGVKHVDVHALARFGMISIGPCVEQGGCFKKKPWLDG